MKRRPPRSTRTDTRVPDTTRFRSAIAEEKAAQSGKPAEIVGKMVDGAIAKYRKENALLSQLFVMDGKTPVAEVVAAAGKDVGAAITLKGFVRFKQIGRAHV